MSTPTDEQQLRATLRRHAREHGAQAAVDLAMAAAVDLFPDALPPIPPLTGAAEAADVLSMKATNLKRLSPPLLPAKDCEGNDVIVSGRIPVYRRSEVHEAKARRDARRAATVEAMGKGRPRRSTGQPFASLGGQE